MNHVIDVFPVKTEIISLESFLELAQQHPEQIKSSRIVPPKLGNPGFGSIEVAYRVPKFDVRPHA
jgi:hypothetical protein